MFASLGMRTTSHGAGLLPTYSKQSPSRKEVQIAVFTLNFLDIVRHCRVTESNVRYADKVLHVVQCIPLVLTCHGVADYMRVSPGSKLIILYI